MSSSLRFRADGSFTIVQFTDTHFADNNEKDQQTAALMRQVLQIEQPDLVLFTGDVIDGRDGTDAALAWRLATAPVIEQHLPWAAVFGNHDDENNLSRARQMELQRQLPGCLSLPGPATVDGCGNFLLRVLAPQGWETAAGLYCLDSHAYAEKAIGGYGWIQASQIRWLHSSLRQLGKTLQTVPALIFLHIPLPEYADVWRQGECRGEKNEDICCPLLNSGLFAALRLAGSGRVAGIFAGHDHTNDFCGDLLGIRLCYGRATGYNTYGRDDFRHGARVIRLQYGQAGFSSWLRLDDGRSRQFWPAAASW